MTDHLQVCADTGEGLNHAGVLAGFHRVDENSAKFINGSNINVYYAVVRPNWELSSEVTVDCVFIIVSYCSETVYYVFIRGADMFSECHIR